MAENPDTLAVLTGNVTCNERTLVHGWPVQLDGPRNRIWLPRCGEFAGQWISVEMFTQLVRHD